MSSRDKYGNYVNDEGVVIKITTDKNGKDHISFYGGEVDKPHDAAHININYKDKTWSSLTHNPDKTEKSEGKGGCYLTTACMRHYLKDFDDNCYELTVLRWYKDNLGLKEDVKYYYQIAPIIVRNIDNDINADLVYDYIYDNVVDYCVKEIELGNYKEAYNRYKNSVLELEKYYAKKELEERLARTLKHKLSY